MSTYRKPRFLALFCIGTGFSLLLLRGEAEAIPPPEIVRMGSVIVQVLGVLIVFFSTTFFIIRDKIQALFSTLHGKGMKVLLISLPVLVIAIAVGGTALYVKKKNKDILADAAAVRAAAVFEGGGMVAPGMQFDISDPVFRMKPEEAARRLGDSGYVFIDIREPVEFSARHVPGFLNMRLGDLIAGGQYQTIEKTKKIVLLCESGERVLNVVALLKLRGYEAFYIDKGIRGWQEKKLKFTGQTKAFLPEFRNKYKDLTRDEARQLVSVRNAVLVDVRSPDEFDKAHIDGSVNIPLVNLPTGDLEAALNQLPKDRPVIGVAFERFGAYYSKLLGYLVEQRKGQFGGTLLIQQQNQDL